MAHEQREVGQGREGWGNIVWHVYLGLACLVAGAVLCFNLAAMGYKGVVSVWPLLEAYDEVSAVEVRVAGPKADVGDDVAVFDAVAAGKLKVAEAREQLKGLYWRAKTPEELVAEKAQIVERTVWRARKDMLEGLVYALVAGLVFAFHWRLFRK